MIIAARKHPWIPFLGLLPVTEEGIKYFRLERGSKWDAFVFDWFNFGYIFFVRERRS